MAGHKVQNPRYRVLSGRVSEEEYQAIEAQAQAAGRNVSDTVRMVMTDWQKAEAIPKAPAKTFRGKSH